MFSRQNEWYSRWWSVNEQVKDWHFLTKTVSHQWSCFVASGGLWDKRLEVHWYSEQLCLHLALWARLTNPVTFLSPRPCLPTISPSTDLFLVCNTFNLVSWWFAVTFLNYFLHCCKLDFFSHPLWWFKKKSAIQFCLSFSLSLSVTAM